MKASSIDFVRKEFIWGCKEEKKKKKEERRSENTISFMGYTMYSSSTKWLDFAFFFFFLFSFFDNLIVATVETKFKF